MKMITVSEDVLCGWLETYLKEHQFKDQEFEVKNVKYNSKYAGLTKNFEIHMDDPTPPETEDEKEAT